MKENPTILITGAGGFTGQHACRHFLAKGWQVWGVVLQNNPNIKELNIKSCDLTNKQNVTSMIKEIKPDYVLHVAGLNSVMCSWGDPVKSIEANALSTLYLLEAIRKESHDTRIVVVGSALEYEPMVSEVPHPYSLGKTMQMMIAKSYSTLYHMQIIMAKPSNLIGPGPSNGVCSIIASKVAQMEIGKIDSRLQLTNLSIQRDFLDVRDAVRAYDLLLHSGEINKVYSIGSGMSRSLQEVVHRIKSLTKVPFSVEVEHEESVHEEISMDLKSISELGWFSNITFQSSLQDTLQYFRNIDN